MSKKLKTFIKFAVSFALMTVLVYVSGPEKIIKEIAGCDPFFLIVSFLFFAAGSIVSIYRWYYTMKTLGFGGSFYFYFKSTYKAAFIGQFLPSSIGGDAYRILNVASLGYRKRDAFLGVLIDRGTGTCGIFVVNIIFNNIYTGMFPQSLHVTLNIICAAGIAGFIVCVFIHKFAFCQKYKFLSPIYRLSYDLYRVFNSPKRAVHQFILTMFMQIGIFIGVYYIALSLGVNLNPLVFLVIMPPVVLLMIIPLSLAGWGIREGAMVGFLALVGVSKEAALSISIIYAFSSLPFAFVGFLFWLKSDERKEKEKEEKTNSD